MYDCQSRYRERCWLNRLLSVGFPTSVKMNSRLRRSEMVTVNCVSFILSPFLSLFTLLSSSLSKVFLSLSHSDNIFTSVKGGESYDVSRLIQVLNAVGPFFIKFEFSIALTDERGRKISERERERV